MSQQANPILALTATLSGTVAVHRFVTPAGAQAGAGVNTLGVALQAAGAAGAKIEVLLIPNVA